MERRDAENAEIFCFNVYTSRLQSTDNFLVKKAELMQIKGRELTLILS